MNFQAKMKNDFPMLKHLLLLENKLIVKADIS